MKKMVNIHDAKTQFSKLIAEVEAGEEVMIARAGKPVARLVPVVQEVKNRRLGFAAGLGLFPDWTPEEYEVVDREFMKLWQLELDEDNTDS